MARPSTSRKKKVPARNSKQLLLTDEGQALADLIDKSSSLHSKVTRGQKKASGNQQNGDGILMPIATGVRLSDVGSVLNGLMLVAGEAGIYGIMFKILALIKQRADKVKELDDKAESAKKLADHIMQFFDKMKSRYAGSLDKSEFTKLEEEAVLLFAECARVLGRIISKAPDARLAGQSIWMDKVARMLRRGLTAPNNLQELDMCIIKLEKFASKMSQKDQGRTVNNVLPYLGEHPRVGTKFGQSIDDLKQFVSAGDDQPKISVVHITGAPGAGKSRLAKEIIHAIYADQADSEAGGNTLKLELLQVDCSDTSGSHLVPVEYQRKLLEQIADAREAEGLSHKDVGYTKIQNALRAWKESSIGRRRKVVMFFDNAPTHISVLNEILPDNISKLLPPGSCVLLSMRSYDNDWTSSGVYDRIQRLFPTPTCSHKVHCVKRLETPEATHLFQMYAGWNDFLFDTNERSPSSDIIKDLIGRCEGNPKLLVLFGKFLGSQRRTESFLKDMLTKLGDMDASAFSDETLDGFWSKALKREKKERRKAYARFTAKLGLVYTMKLGEYEDPTSDISNLFDGWSWNTVKDIFGGGMMRKLEKQKFVFSHVAFQNLYKDLVKGGYEICSSFDLAALMNKCGRRSPLQLKVVRANPELSDTARNISGDKHLRAVNSPIPNQLFDLETGVSKNLRSLCLLDCKGKFQLRWLDRIQGLHYLILHNIEEIEGVAVKSQEVLSYLYWGSMSKIHFPFAVENLPNLRTLVLADFDFSSKPKVGIPPLLQNLSLIRCQNIHLVATDIFKLTVLKSLHLQECEGSCEFTLAGSVRPKGPIPFRLSFQNCTEMKRIPMFIQKLRCSTDLVFISCPKLEGKELQSVPKRMEKPKQESESHTSPSLKTVSFEDCRSFTCLPAELAPYSECLTELEIKSCKLQAVSPHIAQFKNLKKLTLASCPPLKTLPPEIGDLNNLLTLSLQESRGLRTLPPEIGKLQSLKELKLDYCQSLQSLPMELENLKRLSTLSMSFCYGFDPNVDLSKLPDLGKLPKLEDVNIVGLQPESVYQKLAESTIRRKPSFLSRKPMPRTSFAFAFLLFGLVSELLYSLSAVLRRQPPGWSFLRMRIHTQIRPPLDHEVSGVASARNPTRRPPPPASWTASVSSARVSRGPPRPASQTASASSARVSRGPLRPASWTASASSPDS